jgi:hypothetical protein
VHALTRVAGGPLAEGDLPARAFGVIGLAVSSRSSQAGVAHAILERQPDSRVIDIGATAFRVAAFEATAADLTPLRNLVAMVGDLKTAIVYVRGRYYPTGQTTRLYQWLTCFERMQGMDLPISACDFCTRGEQVYRLPCSLLGSFHAWTAPGQADAASYYETAGAREGFDRCPRYVPERLIRLR